MTLELLLHDNPMRKGLGVLGAGMNQNRYEKKKALPWKKERG